jgi:hypothetical protein
MTLVERATKSANSLADQAVSTVSEVGTAIAEGIVVTARDLRAGIHEGNIRPRTVVAAATIGLVAVVEWPVFVAAGGVALVARKLRKQKPDGSDTAESLTHVDTDSAEPAPPDD